MYHVPFRLRNIGDQDLSVQCSVTGDIAPLVELASSQCTVRPGASADVTLVLDISEQTKTGRYEGAFVAESNAKGNPRLELRVVLTVNTHPAVNLIVSPTKLEFNDMVEGVASTKEVEVTRADNEPVDISVTNVPRWCSVQTDRLSERKIRLKVTANLPRGKRRLSDTLQLTEKRSYVTVAQLPISVAKRKMATCEPSVKQVDLMPMVPGMSAQKQFSISNGGDMKMMFDATMRVSASWEGFVEVQPAKGTIKPGKKLNFRVKARVPRESGLVSENGAVHIRWNGGRASRDVPCHLHVRSAIQPVNPGKRLYAWLIDVIHLGLTIAMIMIAFRVNIGEYGFVLVRRYLIWLLVLYPVLAVWWTSVFGGTPGKRALGIEVRNVSDMKRPSLLTSALRYVASLILFPIVWWTAQRDEAWRGVHDRIAGTIVTMYKAMPGSGDKAA
jgi:uncharacterized RDD family membrane protein YckC